MKNQQMKKSNTEKRSTLPVKDARETIVYERDGSFKLELLAVGGVVWMTMQQIGEVFGVDRSVVGKHIRNIYATGELKREATWAKIAQVQIEGARQVTRNVEYYNLDMIIAVGYRVKASAFVRALGAKALLTNDNNGARHGEGEGSTSMMDYVDNHFYVDHPEFLEEDCKLPSKCANANPVKLNQPATFGRGYARNSIKPYAIMVWNFAGPGRYRALGGVLTGALRREMDGMPCGALRIRIAVTGCWMIHDSHPAISTACQIL